MLPQLGDFLRAAACRQLQPAGLCRGCSCFVSREGTAATITIHGQIIILCNSACLPYASEKLLCLKWENCQFGELNASADSAEAAATGCAQTRNSCMQQSCTTTVWGSKSDFNKLASTFILSILGGLFPGLKMRWRTKNYKYEVITLLPMPLSKRSFQGKGDTINLILRKIHVIAKKEIANPICTLAA